MVCATANLRIQMLKASSQRCRISNLSAVRSIKSSSTPCTISVDSVQLYMRLLTTAFTCGQCENSSLPLCLQTPWLLKQTSHFVHKKHTSLKTIWILSKRTKSMSKKSLKYFRNSNWFRLVTSGKLILPNFPKFSAES